MNALIIDDENKARNLLKTILKEYCPEIKTIWEAKDLPSGVVAINKENPDVVFLDVEMPGYAGTQILDFFDETQINFQIIFTTAYQEYALKAFELNAISYILKPIRPLQVKEAVKRVIEVKSNQQINIQLEALTTTLKTNSFTKIALPVSDGILFVKLNNIIYLNADGMYTRIVTTENKTHLISKPLKHFVNILSEHNCFYRTHRSYLINKNYIKQIVRKEGGHIIMDNNEMVSVSKDNIDFLLKVREL